MARDKDLESIFDGLTTFEGGVNSGVVPSLVRHNQLHQAFNASLRGGFIGPRSMFHQRTLDFDGDSVLQTRFRAGRWQGAETYRSDSGKISLIAVINGRVFRIDPTGNTYKVMEITPIIQTLTTVVFVAPAIGAVVAITVSDTSNFKAGYEIEILGRNYVVESITSPTDMVVRNVDEIAGTIVPIGTPVIRWDLNPASRPHAWLWQSEKWMIINDGQSIPIFFDGATARRSRPLSGELTAGRMGVYWKGRNWWVNPDGLTFRAGDAVYSSSGTIGENKRDAVLKQTQNTFLTTGQFSVPTNAGEILAMRDVANLDVSLGQGPLQVLTATTIFNCDAPVDETQWQSTTNVLLSVSQVDGGGLSQYSTVVANGDLFYRSFPGIQTLILGRRDFQQRWGNKPISREMNSILKTDNPALLDFSTALKFDNRLLMSTQPTISDRGVYHRGLISLDFDILSTLQGSTPPVYDGAWSGLQTLQMVKGTFGVVERAFSFSLNAGLIDLFEIMPWEKEFEDTNDGQPYPVVWSFETGDLFNRPGPEGFELIRLMDGEIHVEDIRGRVDFRIFYYPDTHPCPIFWHGWSVCADQAECLPDPFTCLTILNPQPQYRTRMGFGEPKNDCDPITNKLFRDFYTCRLRIVIQGWCKVTGIKLRATKQYESSMAPVMCQSPECDLLSAEPEPEPDGDVLDAWLTHENAFWQIDDTSYWKI